MMALIQESAKEARRLAIAGSTLAVGDFRMKKLIAPLEQSGTKVPVFAQVAKTIGELVNGTEADSAANLLTLSTLLNAILYTQGHSGATGEFRELEAFATNCSCTRTPARVLKPLVKALTTTGAGRFEQVKSACERGVFNDLRLIDPAIQALGDIFPELADLVAKQILPAYGPGIVPRLKATLDLKGRRQDARKLIVLHQLDPAGAVELCKTALEDGSPEVKAAAIACLGEHEECLPLVLEQAGAKNKLLRAAALEALAAHDRPEVTKLFIELIQGKALDCLAGPFRSLRNRQVLDALLMEGTRVFELVAKGDAELIPRYWEILGCLTNRSEPETEEFVLRCFSQAGELAPLKAAKNSSVAGTHLMLRLMGLLYGIGSPRALEAILAKHDTLPAAAFGFVLRSALRAWPADRVYQEFSPLVELAKGAGREKGEVIEQFVATANWDQNSQFIPPGIPGELDETGERTVMGIAWDPRWLDAAIRADRPSMVCSLARPGHEAVITYLVNSVGVKKTADAGQVIRALARCEYPKITDFFLNHLAKKIKSAKHVDFELQCLFESARHLPATDLPKLDAFAATLDENFVDRYLEALAPLRPTQQLN